MNKLLNMDELDISFDSNVTSATPANEEDEQAKG